MVLVVAGIAVVVSEVLFAPPRPSERRPASRTPSPSVQTPSVPTARHTNAAAGYSFLRPVGWEVSDSGTVSELTGPDRDVTVSFGLGPDGGLRAASEELAASIEDTYDDAELEGARREDIAGRPAIVVGGSAVNEAGVSLRFLAITLRIGGENYSISVFVSDASDPVRILPSVEDIIVSFEAA
jgi:hypothetical protein